MKDEKLTVFNIQKYSLHDGSGIRTVIFLKGCPLRCKWCSNPESQNASCELMYRKSRCIGCKECGLCKISSPEAVDFDSEGKAVIDFSKISEDLTWTECCPSKALCIEGKKMAIDEILDVAEQDAVFYRNGNGGLTLSGGEPLFQKNSLILLKKAKERRIKTCIETCGFYDTERILGAAKYLDEIIYDIKSLDEKKHISFTGVSNVKIIENLKALCTEFPDKKVTVRTPVIPGFNDKDEELEKIENFLSGFKNIKWEKLKYHTFGVGKYEMLGRKYELETKEE